ncbi:MULTISPECIES: hypothetical protein [Kribbella]|uniref:Secreted protein with PEP-CTERM sorting signal n=1 Tax=Kribbella karoonensis TaxID=324851 RepID=A0ABN2E3T4_9ACTN
MKRFVVSLLAFLVLSFGVGMAVSGPDFVDWGVAVGLFAIAIAGEGFRFWLQRSRAKKRDSSGV